MSCVAFRSPNYTAGRDSFLEGNYYQAFKQLYPAAQEGNPDAQYAIGYMYYYGLGTSQNQQSAIAWMQRAANQGQAQAIRAVDSILNTGYTSTTGYTDGLSRPSLLQQQPQYVPANEHQREYQGNGNHNIDVPSESNSRRKASWPPPRSEQSTLILKTKSGSQTMAHEQASMVPTTERY